MTPDRAAEKRPWCCPEPRCQPLHQLRNEPLDVPSPGESFVCFGRAPNVEFVYDGADHANDLRSCHYTPLKGLIANQENADDWAMLSRAYAMALKAERERSPSTKARS